MVDGDENLVQSAKEFFRPNRSASWFPPYIVHAWVTAENVDQLIKQSGFAGDIDLLSLDLDGVDYWIWKAMESVSPRVVVAEYNCAWGPTESKTVPYKADHDELRSALRSLSRSADQAGSNQGFETSGNPTLGLQRLLRARGRW